MEDRRRGLSYPVLKPLIVFFRISKGNKKASPEREAFLFWMNLIYPMHEKIEP
ncbi:hypothetical protein P872_12370 [Rhodonellum psychrophilum GCM71 = DSM 17998]|uniref:Uncharacterized protein n=2 Tax=Rhodonellum TaxID=336827 RepID=U5BSI7_9BACT|nr:hypothetical protein P872_12370 [Rhodonellum psychrophilum GCM71 = DSM 17998]SDZ07129.1 hypothetical protein SAMN05444412_105154 [Rhodonellum ikkaensis]